MTHPGSEDLSQFSDEARSLITSMISDVQMHDLVKQDWSTSLGSAPVSIAILGECLLVCSINNASRIILDHAGLNGKTLPTNLLEIVQMGSTAFIKAEIGMGHINVLSHRISMPGGIIDKIVRYALKKPTPTNRKLFEIEIRALKKASKSCAAEAKQMLEQMEAWGQHVKKIWLALTEKDAAVYAQKLKKEEEREKQMKQEKKLAVEAERARRQLESRRSKVISSILAQRQRQEDLAEYGPGAVSALASITIINPLLGCALFGITAIGLLAVEANPQQAEKLYEEQLQVLERTRLEEEKLAQEIEALQDESKSLAEVKRTVAVAMEKIIELDGNIRQLLLYFEGATKMVDDIHEHQDSEFGEVAKIDVPEDEEEAAALRVAMLEKAFQVKVYFVSMHKIAEAYGDISHEYIIGGFDEIGRLGLSSTSQTPGQIADKQAQLSAFRRNYSNGVRLRTQQRQRELQTLLQSTVTKCAEGVLTIQDIGSTP